MNFPKRPITIPGQSWHFSLFCTASIEANLCQWSPRVGQGVDIFLCEFVKEACLCLVFQLLHSSGICGLLINFIIQKSVVFGSQLVKNQGIHWTRYVPSSSSLSSPSVLSPSSSALRSRNEFPSHGFYASWNSVVGLDYETYLDTSSPQHGIMLPFILTLDFWRHELW